MSTSTLLMCLCVNKDIFEKIGAVDLLPPSDDRNWTYDQFTAALQAVKDANLDGVYPTILWAANQSGDACNMSYLWGYGARFFENGDYSKVVLNSQAGYDALSFLNQLSADGLTVPGAAGLNDDDMWAMWQGSQVAITGGYPYLETLAKEADSPFVPYFVNYPHADGEPNPPVAPDTHAISVFSSDDEAENEMACEHVREIFRGDGAVRALGHLQRGLLAGRAARERRKLLCGRAADRLQHEAHGRLQPREVEPALQVEKLVLAQHLVFAAQLENLALRRGAHASAAAGGSARRSCRPFCGARR